ncbi:hypothetical protein CDO23_05055 [Sinorhizobium meliloti]|nr:hypothetical protein CDO23_05055 [Sinorhizobium meliloti]
MVYTARKRGIGALFVVVDGYKLTLCAAEVTRLPPPIVVGMIGSFGAKRTFDGIAASGAESCPAQAIATERN